MTGPEHYREAEQLRNMATNNPFPHLRTSELLAAAQVHATLALAAATAMTSVGHALSPNAAVRLAYEWIDLVGAPATTDKDGAA